MANFGLSVGNLSTVAATEMLLQFIGRPSCVAPLGACSPTKMEEQK